MVPDDPELVEDADVEVVVEVQVAVFADWPLSQVVPPEPPPDPSSDPALEPPPDPPPDPAPDLLLVVVAGPALVVVTARAPLVVPALPALAVPADLAVVRRADSMLGGGRSSESAVLDAGVDDLLAEAEDVISSYLREENVD